MVDDDDTSPHHDSRQPQDLADIQREITQTGAALCALIASLLLPHTQTLHLQPMALTTTMANPTDNDDGSYHDNHWQPIDLLQIQ